MQTKLLIQIRGGGIVHIASNNNDLQIQIIDWDWEDGPGNEIHQPDLVLEDADKYKDFVQATIDEVPNEAGDDKEFILDGGEVREV